MPQRRARMQLTNNLAGLMALCKNIREPIRACKLVLVIFYLES
jgi:hypothetical protein